MQTNWPLSLSDCFTAYCRKCGIYGHAFETCKSPDTYSSAVRAGSKLQESSTAEASIDDNRQYVYRDGGVEPVEGGSGRRVVSGGSSAGDPDTPSVVTTGMSVHAAGSAAGCRSRPGAEVDPLYPPARPPTALVASGCSSIPAETGNRLPPPVEAQATDLTVSTQRPSRLETLLPRKACQPPPRSRRSLT